ncbi:MAG: hypothetical protein ACWGMZ_07450 [Thermoguttaceae bacterium]
MRYFVLSFAAGLLVGFPAIASETAKSCCPTACTEVQTCGSPDCCAHCGCHCGCEKYCKLVCTMKKVKKTVWVVKCEDFCTSLPGCGRCCCDGCESCGDECRKEARCENCRGKSCNPCASLENRDYIPPRCGKVRTKKVLVKKEIICKVPAYKCVVVYSCGNCGEKCCPSEKSEKQQEPAALPPTPAPAPKSALQSSTPIIVDTSFLR